MVKYYIKEDRKLTELEAPRTSCWINMVAPLDPDALQEFADEHLIPLDFLTDALDIDERSRYEREDDARLILINTPLLNEGNHDNEAIYITVPVGIVLTPDHIITICSVENPVLDRFLEGRVKNFDPSNFSLFVLQVFEQCVWEYLECLKKLNLKRHLIEQELYDSARNSELKQLLRIEKSLVYFVNSLSTNELLNMKIKRTDFLHLRDDEVLNDLFEDIIIDNGQALEMANVHTKVLGGTMETYASIISNNMNAFIQRLTVITIILMVPTLVASFYGMNLPNLPMDDSNYAFYIILFISLGISVLLVWFFRRKDLF